MKWIIVFILLFVPITAFAEIHGFLEIGKAIDEELARAQIELQWWVGNGSWKNELYGGWETWFFIKDFEGSPFRDEYKIGNRVHYHNFYLEFEHYCNHPVFSLYHKGVDNRYITDSLTAISIGVQW